MEMGLRVSYSLVKGAQRAHGEWIDKESGAGTESDLEFGMACGGTEQKMCRLIRFR